METLETIQDSIAYSVLNDLLRAKELTPIEADFLRKEYYDRRSNLADKKQKDLEISKKCGSLQEDIMNQRLLYEKSKIDESDEMRQYKKLEDAKQSLLMELEISEQQEMISKFELSELQRIHEELTAELSQLHAKNESLVNPIINGLHEQISDLSANLTSVDESLEKETTRKNDLLLKIAEMEKIHLDKGEVMTSKLESLKVADSEPVRVNRQVESIEKALQILGMECNVLMKKKESLEKELSNQKISYEEAENIRKSLLEKLDINRKTLQSREQDVSSVASNLDSCRAKVHDYVLKKVELNAQRKELESDLRRKIDEHNFAKKDYENLKRQLKKKRLIVDSVKEVIPKLEEQKKDLEINLQMQKHDCDNLRKSLQTQKDLVDSNLAKLLQYETSQSSKKLELDAMISENDEVDTKIQGCLTEGKRLRKVFSVLNAQKDVKSRECARLAYKEKEANQMVKIKELTILDLTKRCNEISNRLKEFSALYEVVKNERNRYVNMIQSSSQALAEMKEKIRILTNEVEILGNESNAKDIALSKEKAAHLQAQRQRDSLRQDMNRLLAEYRLKQSSVEQQIQEIAKMNVVISTLEKDMLEVKSRYEKAVDDRNTTGVQLIDRNDELCLLYERANQQQDAYRKGETLVMQKDEELRIFRLQVEDLKRNSLISKLKLPLYESYQQEILDLESSLVEVQKKNDELSGMLEDPHNLQRWRALDGEDCESDQLIGKIEILESRLDKKREIILEKELVLEELNRMSDKLRGNVVTHRDGAKSLSEKFNATQISIRNITKNMLATVSELSMYQASALKLQQEKLNRERALEEAKWHLQNGEAPFPDAIKEIQNIERKKRDTENQLRIEDSRIAKTTAPPRPTAYIPDDLGIPKPYGMLPFKPSATNAALRHIKPVTIKPIDI